MRKSDHKGLIMHIEIASKFNSYSVTHYAREVTGPGVTLLLFLVFNLGNFRNKLESAKLASFIC